MKRVTPLSAFLLLKVAPFGSVWAAENDVAPVAPIFSIRESSAGEHVIFLGNQDFETVPTRKSDYLEDVEINVRSVVDVIDWGMRQTIEENETFQDCPKYPEIQMVPAGSFKMGSPTSDANQRINEEQQHFVTIDRPFAVGVYDVAFEEWGVCVSDNGCNG